MSLLAAHTHVRLGTAPSAIHPKPSFAKPSKYASFAPDFDATAFVNGLQVSVEQRDAIAKYPQGGEDWARERVGRLTTSMFHEAMKHPMFGDSSRVLKAMVWPELAGLQGIGAVCAAWGTSNEGNGRDVYTADRKSKLGSDAVEVTETGLVVSLEHGWLGCSPDFFVRELVPEHEAKAMEDIVAQGEAGHVSYTGRRNGAGTASRRGKRAREPDELLTAVASPPPVTYADMEGSHSTEECSTASNNASHHTSEEAPASVAPLYPSTHHASSTPPLTRPPLQHRVRRPSAHTCGAVVTSPAPVNTQRQQRPQNRYHLAEPYIIHHPTGAQAFIAEATVHGEAKQKARIAGQCYNRDAHGNESHDGSNDSDGGRCARFVWVSGCGEIKCPATGVLYAESGKHAEHGFPVYYYDQIQGQMALNNLPWCDVVVYTPARTHVTRFYRNHAYWDNEMFPALKHFYFNVFLPTLRLRVCGMLKPGEVIVSARPLPPLPQLSATGLIKAAKRRVQTKPEDPSDA